ncbi:hypothetical protein FB451DRAFT_1452605 [Mycena latifolia]|nr:hypothetical protein FB451DRAFT_1452605 [Mycena latifolia]
MSVRRLSNVPASKSSPQRAGSPFQPFEPSRDPSSNSNWLASLLLNARAINAAAESLPLPYVKGVFGTAVFLLETVEKVKRNRDELKQLCADVVDIITVVRDRISFHRDTAALQFKVQCEELDGFLQDIMETVHHRQMKPQGLGARLKEFVNSSNTADEIRRFRDRIHEVRSNFMISQLPKLLYRSKIVLLRPEYSMQQYFPQCNHGNILITSRNPGLCVYAGAHYAVSDMEETDAVDLLLRSSAQDATSYHRETATQIVRALCYLPLAIIQAGAFISKSGNLNNYLALYTHSKDRLLIQRPAQSHDNYAWTVFDQLSQEAKTFLKLCSSLHYQGISEDIFKNATKYTFKPCGPSQAELQMAFKVLSQFLGPSGAWDPLCFLDVTNELRAHSLINFDSEKNMLSIHPLVHQWTRNTLSDEEHLHCMNVIAGMSLAGLPEKDLAVISLWMLPHIDCLLKANSNVIPDFQLEYGKVYLLAGDPRKAEELEVAVLKQRRNLLGEDHPYTLDAMYWLSWTYEDLGRLKEAEALGVVLLEKRRNILGDNHPDTLDALANLALVCNSLGKLQEAQELGVSLLPRMRSVRGENHPDTLVAMGNLALTYSDLGKLKEAEELWLVVFEKRKSILGENHPDTLRAMAGLACTYSKMGRLEEAEQLELNVLEKQRNIVGDNHMLTLSFAANLAATYRRLGKLQDAEELEVMVLKRRKQILGENHPSTLHTMSNLGSTFNNQEKWKEAEGLLVDALKKQTDVLSQNNPHIIDTMERLAVTYNKLGKFKEEEDLKIALKRRHA